MPHAKWMCSDAEELGLPATPPWLKKLARFGLGISLILSCVAMGYWATAQKAPLPYLINAATLMILAIRVFGLPIAPTRIHAAFVFFKMMLIGISGVVANIHSSPLAGVISALCAMAVCLLLTDGGGIRRVSSRS